MTNWKGRGRLVALAAAMALGSSAARGDDRAPGFTVETLAPGVHALVRTKPAGFLLDANVLVVVGDDGALVVDSNLTPTSAEASIAAIRRLTPKPVRFLVNTHRHHDHVGGNEVYRRDFPGVEIVGHAAMADDLRQQGEQTMAGWTGWAAEMVTEIPKALEKGVGFGGQPLSAAERASYAADRAAAQEIVADTPRMRVALPTATVSDRRTVALGGRTVEILHLGKGHTRGDLVVWLPGERIVAAGDLLVAPVPLVGGDQSYVAEWIETLGKLKALGAAIYLPGHGAVQRGDAQLDLYRDFLASVREQTESALAKGSTLEQAIAAVDVTSFRDRMAGDDPVLRILFANWGRVPAVTALYRVRDEAKSTKP